MPEATNGDGLGPPTTFYVRDVPEIVRAAYVRLAQREGVKVADVLTRIYATQPEMFGHDGALPKPVAQSDGGQLQHLLADPSERLLRLAQAARIAADPRVPRNTAGALLAAVRREARAVRGARSSHGNLRLPHEIADDSTSTTPPTSRQ
jgi:hypothetical protein